MSGDWTWACASAVTAGCVHVGAQLHGAAPWMRRRSRQKRLTHAIAAWGVATATEQAKVLQARAQML